MDMTKLSADQLRKFVQDEKKKNDQAKANLVKVHKSAADLSKVAKAVDEISQKNPEL